jgi:hypothetical protein
MITCKLSGGLGNQLFQIFTVIALSLKTKLPFIFIGIKQLGNGENGSTIRYTYWDTFFQSLTPFLRTTDQLFCKSNLIYEKNFDYDSNITNYLRNNELNILIGYFQSPLYFNNYKIQILRLLKIKEKKEYIRKTYFENMHYMTNMISLHFRIGDYAKFQNCHPIMSIQYYIDALKYITTNATNATRVLYFCERQDFDLVIDKIVILKNEFPNLEFICIDFNIEDWIQMLIMSMCSYNIIANSTYSWWSAYLNENTENIVCYPSKWFGPNLENNNTCDLFPLNWVKVDTN